MQGDHGQIRPGATQGLAQGATQESAAAFGSPGVLLLAVAAYILRRLLGSRVASDLRFCTVRAMA